MSVSIIVCLYSGDPKLCSQDAAYHSIGVSADGFAVVQTSVQREVNPDLFCIHFSNSKWMPSKGWARTAYMGVTGNYFLFAQAAVEGIAISELNKHVD